MVSLSLKGGNEERGGMVAATVEVSGVVEEEVETIDPNFLQKSSMLSWMLTMPRCDLFIRQKLLFYPVSTVFVFLMMFLLLVSDGHQLRAVGEDGDLKEKDQVNPL